MMRQSSSSFDEMEASLKENFRLSSYEARSYLSLLKIGKQTPKELARNANVPLPRVYDTLDSLMSKGFVIEQEEYYAPTPPKLALHGRSIQFEADFAREQKVRQSIEKKLGRELERSRVQARQQRVREDGEISILKGIHSIANKFAELLNGSSDIILVAKRAVEAKEVFIPILLEFGTAGSSENSIIAKGGTGSRSARRPSTKKPPPKSIRIIVPKQTLITKEELAVAKRASATIRKSDHILFDMMITDSNDVLIGVPDPLSDEINHAVGIWVRNSSFAGSTRASVEELWKSSSASERRS